MTNFVIPAPAITKISIKDSQDFFPVRRIYCIGRNYADHAVEMGFDPKDDPFFFQNKYFMSKIVSDIFLQMFVIFIF